MGHPSYHKVGPPSHLHHHPLVCRFGGNQRRTVRRVILVFYFRKSHPSSHFDGGTADSVADHSISRETLNYSCPGLDPMQRMWLLPESLGPSNALEWYINEFNLLVTRGPFVSAARPILTTNFSCTFFLLFLEAFVFRLIIDKSRPTIYSIYPVVVVFYLFLGSPTQPKSHNISHSLTKGKRPNLLFPCVLASPFLSLTFPPSPSP
jgi:hypothetical protein